MTCMLQTLIIIEHQYILDNGLGHNGLGHNGLGHNGLGHNLFVN